VLLVIYQVVVGAPVTGTHHKRLSREFQRLDTQLRDCLTEGIPRMGSYYLRRFGEFGKLRKVDEFGDCSVQVRFRQALPLRRQRRVLFDDLFYLFLATLAQGGELAILRYYVGPPFGSH
jgi:hypothetical protein